MVDYTKFLDHIVEMARVNLERDGHLAPVCFIGNSERGEIGTVLMDMSSADAKDASAFAVARIAALANADFVVMVSESWTLPQDKLEDFTKNRDKYPNLSDHPDKYEVVMFSVETHAGHRLAMVPMKRTKKKVTFGEVKFQDAPGFQGRFASFLPKRSDVQ